MEPDKKTLVLPMQLATLSDLSRVARELEELDLFLRDGAIRQPGSPMQLPKSSKLFEDLVAGSKLNMINAGDREYLQQSLGWLREHAPLLHISFGSEASVTFVEQLTIWLRKNISPLALIQVGLHPNIGAGCVVRTTNKYFDFSLRKHFMAQRELLMHQLLTETPTKEAKALETPA